jgi:hypothetical protein
VRVVVKFIDIRLAVANQIYGQRERAGRIHVVVEIQLAMHRARLQDLGLQGNADCDQLFLIHGPGLVLFEQRF